MWTYLTLKTARIWGYFTYETLKICDQIVKKPPELRCEYCCHYFPCDFMAEREGHIYVCKRCEEDEELETRYGDEKAA